MAIHVQDFSVSAFRGIQNFSANNLNHVNLLVGDNNCGKTSLLEGLQILRNPLDLANLLKVAKQREAAYSYSKVSVFENFLTLFPHFEESLRIQMHATCRNTPVDCMISGEEKRVLLDEFDIQPAFGRSRRAIPSEANAFTGKLECVLNSKHIAEPIHLHEYSRISGMEIKKDSLLNVVYLSPFDHIRGNVINNIIRNDNYKDICLHLARLFDPDIVDFLILKNEQTNRPVEYIKHKILGNMPVSTYGDGIKKVLLLANAIASAVDGVLLIDEIDTAIHHKYYYDVFSFLIKACLQYNVQLFITTHSIEAVDSILATQHYQHTPDEEYICVMTLKKSNNRTLTRSLPGKAVFENRETFGFEVRL